MEIFLLIADELDDVTSAAKMLLPNALGFLTALALFALTVLAFMQWPLLVSLLAGMAGTSLLLGSLVRERLLTRSPRTDG